MKKFAILALIAVAITSTIVIAEEHNMREGDEVIAILGLTPDQQVVFRSAHAEFQTAAQPLFEQARALHRQINESVTSASPDACAIGGLVLQEQSINAQIKAKHEALAQKIAAVLTPEQRTKFEVLKTQHENRGMMMEHHQ